MQPAAIGRCQNQLEATERLPAHAAALGLPITDRPTAEAEHLECAQDPLRIAGPNASGRRRVDPLQLLVQDHTAATGKFGLQLRAQLRVGLGHQRQAVEQGAEIQAGAAHQDRQPTALADLQDQAFGLGSKLGSAVRLPGGNDIDQMVGHTFTLGQIGLRRADIHALVNQGRIDADHLAVEFFRQGNAGRGLARSRRPHQSQHRYPLGAGGQFSASRHDCTPLAERAATANRPVNGMPSALNLPAEMPPALLTMDKWKNFGRMRG